MSLWRRFFGALFGANGFDRAKHEMKVRQLKKEEQECYGEIRTSLDRLKDAFSRIDLESSPPEALEGLQPFHEKSQKDLGEESG